MWARVQGPYYPWPGSRPWPHSPSKFLGVSFLEFFVIFSLSCPSPDSTGAPTVRPRDRQASRRSPVASAGAPAVCPRSRQALRRTPLALTGAPADGPYHRPLFWPFALGLHQSFRRPSSASSGFSPSGASFVRGSHQPSPALADFSQFVSGHDRALRLRSPLAVQFRAKNSIAFGHMYTPSHR